MQETQVRSLGQEYPLEKGMATHCSILPGESHGQRSLVVYSPWGHKEADTTQRLTHTKVPLGYNLPDKERHYRGAFLVVQWLRLCASSAGAQVQSLARDLDPTCGN